MQASNPQTIQELISSLSRAGQKTALLTMLDEGLSSLSYADLANRVELLAAGLAGQGIGRGSQVALLAENRPEWIIACLAIIHAGATLVPLDVQLGDETLSHIFRDSEVELVFTTFDMAERLKKMSLAEIPELILFDGPEDDKNSFPNQFGAVKRELPHCQPVDNAALFYTSGTTGPPKGVPLSHGNLAFQVRTVRRTKLISPQDRVLLPLPFHHVYPLVIGLLVPLGLNLPVILPKALTGPQILRAAREGPATIIIGVPRLYKALFSGITAQVAGQGKISELFFTISHQVSTWLNRKFGLHIGKILLRPVHKRFGPSLRVLASGGAALDPELAWKLEGLGWQVAIGYGLTETSPLLTINPPGTGKLGSVGQPVEEVAIRIDTQERSGEKSRETGEILAKGPSVFSGYRNLPDKNDKVLTQDGWFRTGDLGFLNGEGFLYLQGRSSTLIVTESGKNIQPDEVEEQYAAHSLIREAGILQYENRLVAVIVPDLTEIRRTGEKDIEEAVRRAVREQSRKLPTYQRLDDYVISRDALARTRLGKIRRHILFDRYKEIKTMGKRPQAGTGPISRSEMSDHDQALLDSPAVKTVWDWLARRYPQIRLTPDTSTGLDLGIDSLEWLNLTMDIGERTGIELSEEAIGRIDTVRDLLEEIAGQAEKGETSSPDQILENPEQVIDYRQQRWLRPLNLIQLMLAYLLYLLNKFVMRFIFRLKIVGLENIPKDRQFLLTANHLSALDPFVIVASLPFSVLQHSFFAGYTGIAFRNFFFRFVSRLAKAVPIDPRQAVASSLAFGAIILKRKNNLIWFPEGERSRDGRLQEFKPGVGMLLDHYRVTVLPAFIRGTYEALPRGQILPKIRKVSIQFAEPVDPDSLTAGYEDKPREGIRKGLYERVAGLRDRTG